MSDWSIRSVLPAETALPIEPDRGGYTLTMRECSGAEDVLARLDVAPGAADGNRVHMGWGSFRNLDIAAARRSSWVLLMDVNVHQFRVWEGVRAALRDPGVTTAAAFVEAVVPLLPHQPRLRQFSTCTRTWLMGDLERPGSWLFAERPERFDGIRQLFLDDRIAVGCMDLRGGAQPGDPFGALASRMETARGRVAFDTLYVSNIPWMLAQHRGFFGESHADFLRPGARDVRHQVQNNLRAIAPLFGQVVSAAHLRPDAVPANLQWHTETLPPAAFLDDGYWDVLVAIDDPAP